MSWENRNFKELGFLGRGKSRHRPRNDESLYGGDYPMIQTGDVKAANFYLNSFSQTYNDKGLAQSKLWNPNTLCITIAANIAETAILGMKACFPDSIIGFIADEEKSDVRFIKYFFDIYKERMQRISQGATQDNLSLEKLLTFEVPTPPLQTQKRIADILSAYDDLIENNLKRIKLLEQAAQNIYKEWFVNLRFPGHENTPINEETELPEGWEEKTISEVMEYKVDNRGKNPKYYTKSGIPVIDNHLIKNSPNIDLSKTKRYIDDELFDVFIRRYLKKDDVLITLVGTVANISLAPEEKSVIIQNTIGIRCNEFCTQEYMYCFLGANKTKIQNKNRGAAQPSVKVGDLTGMKMVIPNNELLNNFSKEIKTMFSLIQTLGKQNSQLKEGRDILLPRLMNRTIEV